MRGRHAERGFTLVEAFVLLGVTVLFVATLLSARGRDLQFLREAARDAAARRACAARLEALAADRSALLPGVRPLPAAGGPGSLLEAAEGEERVREVEPGLFEVEVRIAWPLPGGGRGESRLATLLAGGAR